MKGKLTIGLFNSNDPKYNNKLCIRIEDENYNLISEIVVPPANFALATAGLACQECEIDILQCSKTLTAEIKRGDTE